MLFANSNFSIFFWVFLLLYIFLIFFLTSKSVTKDQFFLGHNKKREYVNTWLLTSSIFISWIFTKSVTNAANLGYSFGIIIRISSGKSPDEKVLYRKKVKNYFFEAIKLEYSNKNFIKDFLSNWLLKNSGYKAYFDRIINGPNYDLSDSMIAK
jgi:hypothetical protein